MIASEPIIVGNVKAFRYRSPLANHVVVIDATAFPSASGFEQFAAFAAFAAFYAGQYAETWCLDQTSRSCLNVEGCAQRMVAVTEHVAATRAALPIFAMGITAGGEAACRAVLRCPSLRGAVLIGPLHGDDAETSCQVKRNGTTPHPPFASSAAGIVGGST